jgi:hypothetical protein
MEASKERAADERARGPTETWFEACELTSAERAPLACAKSGSVERGSGSREGQASRGSVARKSVDASTRTRRFFSVQNVCPGSVETNFSRA